ncbi:MAG: hypothetical protein AAF902_24030, partial [Chloroflexota bacterium]
MDSYTILLSQSAWDKQLEPYRQKLQAGAKPGRLLEKRLTSRPEALGSTRTFLEELINTKKPQIFAESAILGDGSDWNLTELAILGDVSIATPVTIFDNGRHRKPDVHAKPFEGTLLFTPGALLRNGHGEPPADYLAVTTDHKIDPEKYYQLYKRRLLPPLKYADQVCARKSKKGFITIPGLGCGVFAGPFAGQLGQMLNRTLLRVLQQHSAELPNIRAVYYDPYNESQNERHEIEGLSYLVRPLLQGNKNKPQLCSPHYYEETGDDFSDCEFFSFVAWDHVSWPGNDFYVGSRVTDDGVKGAATDAIRAMTGFEGFYDKVQNKYLPPIGFKN